MSVLVLCVCVRAFVHVSMCVRARARHVIECSCVCLCTRSCMYICFCMRERFASHLHLFLCQQTQLMASSQDTSSTNKTQTIISIHKTVQMTFVIDSSNRSLMVKIVAVVHDYRQLWSLYSTSTQTALNKQRSSTVFSEGTFAPASKSFLYV